MPTNANIFNSRVTSEALEAKFRQVFPSQGGAELPQDLFASGVIQPVVDFSSVAEGSILPSQLQQAWDFATGHTTTAGASNTIINNTGFWQVDLNVTNSVNSANGVITITDGLSSKVIWEINTPGGGVVGFNFAVEDKFVVFLRAGDSLVVTSASPGTIIDTWYRQIADVNGTLVNPLGFTFS